MRGRPKSNSTKDQSIRIRLSSFDKNKLLEEKMRTGLTYSQIIRSAMDLYFARINQVL